MYTAEKVIYKTKTKFGHYQVIDMVYLGRYARVLFSGKREAAQAGTPKDGDPRMLFDYNKRFLELIDSLKPKNILLIGGGVFTLPMEVLKNFPGTKIDAVEHDPTLKEIAEKYFGLKSHKDLKIVTGDGLDYLRHSPNKYDLILIDAFEHSTIPEELSTKEFAKVVSQKLNKNGVTAVNIISAYHGPKDEVLKKQFAAYTSAFKHVGIYPADKIISYWVSQNFILVSTNKFRRPSYDLSFDALQPIPLNSH